MAPGPFDRWFAAGANNAGIAAAALYADRVPQFSALLEAEHGDFQRFTRVLVDEFIKFNNEWTAHARRALDV